MSWVSTQVMYVYIISIYIDVYQCISYMSLQGMYIMGVYTGYKCICYSDLYVYVISIHM